MVLCIRYGIYRQLWNGQLGDAGRVVAIILTRLGLKYTLQCQITYKEVQVIVSKTDREEAIKVGEVALDLAYGISGFMVTTVESNEPYQVQYGKVPYLR